MTLEAFRSECLKKKGVTEETPFGPDTLVYKVAGKMFALTGMPDFDSVNLKADPEAAVELREKYEAVLPGYHMNKKHWNTVLMDGSTRRLDAPTPRGPTLHPGGSTLRPLGVRRCTREA